MAVKIYGSGSTQTTDLMIDGNNRQMLQMHVQSGDPIKYGDASTAQTVEKILAISALSLNPVSESVAFDKLYLGYVTTTETAASVNLTNAPLLPSGATVIGFYGELYRAYPTSGFKEAQYLLYKSTAPEGGAIVVTLVHSTSGWENVASSSFTPIAMTSDHEVFVRANLRDSTTGVGDVRAGTAWLKYTVPNMDVTV